MRYTWIKSLITDIQEEKLDPKTILIAVDWKENRIEIFNRDEVIWYGFASNTLLEIIHTCLGIFTIHDMHMALFEERLQDSQQHPNTLWHDIFSMSKEEIFAYLHEKAEKQSRSLPEDHERE